jgi:sugar phosphate isomerase/epimerase
LYRGNIDFNSVFEQLERKGFTGTATLELSFDEDKVESLKRLLTLLKSD